MVLFKSKSEMFIRMLGEERLGEECFYGDSISISILMEFFICGLVVTFLENG